jgi:hypothetical protein
MQTNKEMRHEQRKSLPRQLRLDGLLRMKDVQKEMGGSGVSVAE